MAELLKGDWVGLAEQLGVHEDQVLRLQTELGSTNEQVCACGGSLLCVRVWRFFASCACVEVLCFVCVCGGSLLRVRVWRFFASCACVEVQGHLRVCGVRYRHLFPFAYSFLFSFFSFFIF